MRMIELTMSMRSTSYSGFERVTLEATVEPEKAAQSNSRGGLAEQLATLAGYSMPKTLNRYHYSPSFSETYQLCWMFL